jgi:hypothetical protein
MAACTSKLGFECAQHGRVHIELGFERAQHGQAGVGGAAAVINVVGRDAALGVLAVLYLIFERSLPRAGSIVCVGSLSQIILILAAEPGASRRRRT